MWLLILVLLLFLLHFSKGNKMAVKFDPAIHHPASF